MCVCVCLSGVYYAPSLVSSRFLSFSHNQTWSLMVDGMIGCCVCMCMCVCVCVCVCVCARAHVHVCVCENHE